MRLGGGFCECSSEQKPVGKINGVGVKQNWREEILFGWKDSEVPCVLFQELDERGQDWRIGRDSRMIEGY